MVDDAHGIGVLGATGRGTLEHFGLSAAAVPILMGTLGKALGTFGAFVAGSAELIEYLIQKARTYIYTTALPPAVAAATRAALRLVDEESWRRERVLAHVARFRDAATSAGLEIGYLAHTHPADHPRQRGARARRERCLVAARHLGHRDPPADRARRKRTSAHHLIRVPH